MSDNPVAPPKLSAVQREMLILEAEIKADNARTALKTYRKERLDIQIRLTNIEANEKSKNLEIEHAEATIARLQQEV